MTDRPSDAEKVDILATVEEIRRQVRLLRTSRKESSAHDLEIGYDRLELARSLEEVRAHQGVSAHWPIVWRTPIQALFAFLQRSIRLALRWYINPIVGQQNAFNAATERTLRLLSAACDWLREDIASLEQRLEALEQGLRQEEGDDVP
ncbi:MAG: hypothetical protein ACP5SI_01280 [Chloroflexia bacterium]